MIAAPKALASAAICVAFSVSGCEQRSWTYGYRLTIDVETPEGIHTGSSAIEVDITKAPIAFLDLSNGASRGRLKGEATVVDLGPRGVLFALMLGGNANLGPISGGAAELPTTVFRRVGFLHPKNTGEQNWSQLETFKGKVDLLSSEIPFLVRFTDLQNPKSMVGVDPNNLAASFGPGIHIKQATIEMTHDRPTDDIILKYLPWLRTVSENYYIMQGDNYTKVSGPLGTIQSIAFRWGVR
jgi:hypothetical protein